MTVQKEHPGAEQQKHAQLQTAAEQAPGAFSHGEHSGKGFADLFQSYHLAAMIEQRERPDKEQIFPGKTNQVYFFNESKIIQTTIPDKIQVFKFENGQIEKHYINGIKEIIFPNGNIKKIYQDGTEENLYNDDNENNDEEIEYEDE